MSTAALERPAAQVKSTILRLRARVGAVREYVAVRYARLRLARRWYRHLAGQEAAPASPAVMALPQPDFLETLYHRSLSSKLHGLVRLRVASRIGSVPEVQARMETCRQLGWTDQQVSAALLGVGDDAFTAVENLVLRYADDMTRTPIDVDFQTVRQLRRHFDEVQLHEITACIGHENFRIRFENAARVH